MVKIVMYICNERLAPCPWPKGGKGHFNGKINLAHGLVDLMDMI